MKKTLLTNLIIVTLGLVVTVGISYVYAGVFKDPQRIPPYANMEIPVHAGFDQVKNAGLSVGTFAAYQDAYFDQSASLTGNVYGGIPGATASTVSFGTTSTKVGLATTDDVGIAGTFQSDSLKNTNGAAPVCADSTGTFVLCVVAGSTPTTGGGSSIGVGNSQVNTTNHPLLTKVFDASNGVGVDSQGNTVSSYYYHSTNNANAQVQTLIDRLASSKACAGSFSGGGAAVCSTQAYIVGPVVYPGNVYTLTSPASNSYSLSASPAPQFSASVTAVQGDTPATIAQKLVSALTNAISIASGPLVTKTVLHNVATYTYPGGIYASSILYQDNTILTATPTGISGAKGLSVPSTGYFIPSVAK